MAPDPRRGALQRIERRGDLATGLLDMQAASGIEAAERKDGWPKLTYRYVEHYFWEPQHLLRTASTIAVAAARGESRVEAVHRPPSQAGSAPQLHSFRVFCVRRSLKRSGST